ncbi:histone deacetylase [Lithohypha guttulata]|uniref:Histone deacetylase n=1 Tax=Lithohypha guttulata TaxID=1690604 RepID=A0AAN7YAD4_9EURO|nr:histone deacetylase [Lithohypha guttulata]
MAQDIVEEYNHQSTFTYSSKIEDEIRNGAVEKPKGYRVSWHHNPDVERYHFGQLHPMKVWRLTLTKSLIMGYQMHNAMDLYSSRPAYKEEIARFHKEDYVEFLSVATPKNLIEMYPELAQSTGFSSSVYGVGDDCPIFDGLFEYCSFYAGASIDAASKLVNQQSDIALNWTGGLHHAKKGEASGFCYVNDIVLAIIELLAYHPRVLYIDIDVHHGDGVESAFWSTDRVFCVSFHKYDKEVFFPGTGPLDSTGPHHPDNPGRNHTINVPLNDGITDADYAYLFDTVIGAVTRNYDPSAIVLQCGADSLGHDRLGCFNLNIKGHGHCVQYCTDYCTKFKKPLLVLGGGGYTPRNVARAWAHETSITIGAANKIDPDLPEDMPYREHFRREGMTLFPNLGGWKGQNLNTRADIDKIVRSVHEQMRYIRGAPSVQMNYIPKEVNQWREEAEKEHQARRMEREERMEERDGAGGLLALKSRRRELEKNGLFAGNMGNMKTSEFMTGPISG